MYRIYMITGPNGRRYIGKTCKTPQARFSDHLGSVRRGSTTALACAIRKYGPEAFSITEICRCVDAREAKACERGLIAQYGTMTTAGGYNLTSGGDGNDGWRPSEETRALWREQRKGKRPHEWAVQKPPRPGQDWRSFPENVERMRQMGLAKRGCKISAEHSAALQAGGVAFRTTEAGKQMQLRLADGLVAAHRNLAATNPDYRAAMIARLQISPEQMAKRESKRKAAIRAYADSDEGRLALRCKAVRMLAARGVTRAQKLQRALMGAY